MSRPNMDGPTSARGLAVVFPCRAGATFFAGLLICFFIWPVARVTKNHDRFRSRGFLSKLLLTTTSTDGVAYYYDDYQVCLSNIFEHCEKRNDEPGSVKLRLFPGCDYW